MAGLPGRLRLGSKEKAQGWKEAQSREGTALSPPARPQHRAPPPAGCRDNLRGFFEACFPTLLRRLFGYDGSSWLTAVAKVRQRRSWAGAGARGAACKTVEAQPALSLRAGRCPPTLCNSSSQL